MIMNNNVEQINQILLKILKEVNNPDLSILSVEEKIILARYSSIPPETLTILASDNYPSVRYWVAVNPRTTPETLTLLAKDDSYIIRCDVANNPNTLPETLTLLASDENYYVRKLAKQNPNYNPTETVTLTKQQKEAIQNLIDSSQDEILKTIVF
jgi:hypothetical protein